MAFFALLCSPSVAFAQQDDGEIRQLVQRLQQGVTKIERVNILQKLTEQLSNISPAEAIEYANEGLKIAKSQDNTQAQVHFYLHLGIAHFYGETISKANQNLQKALQMRDASLTQRIQAQQYLALCARHEDEQARTKEYLEKAQQEAEKLGDKNLLAQNAFFKAECENSTQALPHYQSALALYEGVRNEAGYAKTAQALGDFYAEQLNNPLTALYYYQKALSVADRIAEKRILSGTLNAMASVYLHQQNDARTALRYYFQTFVIAQEYDFIQNGSKLAQALKGIQVVYQHIARQRRNAGEIDKARQYDKLAERYQRLGQNLVAADYDVALFGSANPEARTYTSPAPNPDRPRRNVPAETLRKSLRSPLDSQSLLTETRRRADSLLIAHKNSQIDHWQEQTSRQEMQLNNLHDEKLQQEAELRRYKLWWFWGLVGLIAILGGLLSYAIYHIRLQKQLISKQKNRVLEAQEKANRYVIVAREHQDVATQKGAEVAQILAELDEKKLENVSFRKTLQEDVLRPITYAIGQEKAHYALQTLLQESIPTAQNSEQTILPILTSAHTQVARLFQQHNIRFEPHIAENLTCLCDAKLLEAVFVHLFYNSLKYVAKGGTIKIDATNEGKRILLTYKDNGQGIPASLHTQAFRKYPSQEARPLANGLYWVKQLMEAQKASIALQPNAMGITVQMSFEA
jgi:signal transduction histidine kinase